MADLDRNTQSSSPSRITGGDELHDADVIQGGDGFNRLMVKSETSISSDLRILQEWGVNQTLDNVTYFNIYSGSGVITISGFQLGFDDKKVYVKLEIDGIEIFDINVETFKDISDLNSAPAPQTYIAWNDGLKVFYFTPALPIKSETSIVISARSKAGENKKYMASIIQVG